MLLNTFVAVSVTNGDGILLKGHTLYVSRNQQGLIIKLQLSDDLTSGSIVSSTTDPLLAYPTTLAWADGRLLVVNSQFNKRGPGLQPDLPFTIASIPAPEGACESRRVDHRGAP